MQSGFKKGDTHVAFTSLSLRGIVKILNHWWLHPTQKSLESPLIVAPFSILPARVASSSALYSLGHENDPITIYHPKSSKMSFFGLSQA